VHPLLNRS